MVTKYLWTIYISISSTVKSPEITLWELLLIQNYFCITDFHQSKTIFMLKSTLNQLFRTFWWDQKFKLDYWFFLTEFKDGWLFLGEKKNCEKKLAAFYDFISKMIGRYLLLPAMVWWTCSNTYILQNDWQFAEHK